MWEVSGIEIKSIPIEQINPASYNPRKDLQPDDPEYQKLKQSLDKFGYVEPLVWNRRTGNLVGGHQRLKVLQEQGITEVECSVVDLDEAREKTLNVALNKISGEWDFEKLADLLEDIQLTGLDVELTGFDPTEIDELTEQFLNPEELKEDNFDVDEAVEEIEEPVTQPGDVWQLGRHRLLCGDATKLEDVQRLMGDQLADMVFTDPPYNVDYTGSTKRKLKIQNDNMDSERFYAFLHDTFANMNAVTRAGGGIYICHADSEGINFRSAMINTGWELKQCLIWVKNAFVLGRQDYQWMHEPILYGWKAGAKHQWFGDRKQTTVIDDLVPLTVHQEGDGTVLSFTDGEKTVMVKVPSFEVIYSGEEENATVWRYEKPVRNADHPTMKPVGIPAKAIQNSSPQEGIVLDLFSGSGSTLIAAEQTGRACYGMELDPVYCDVIIRRWEEWTGKKAVKEGGEA